MGCNLFAVLEQCREGFSNVEFALNVSGFLLFGFAVGHVCGGEEKVLESRGVDGGERGDVGVDLIHGCEYI